MNKRYVAIALALILAVVFGWYGIKEKYDQTDTGVTVGKMAPQFSLRDLDGNTVAIGPVDRVTVINFWASWCPPCREEMPELQGFAVNSAETAFWAVNIQESGPKVVAFFRNNHYSLPVLLDSDGTVARTFKVNSIPTTIIIDKNGIIKFRKTGGVTRAELEGALKGCRR